MTPLKKPVKKAFIGSQYRQISSPAAINAATNRPIGLKSSDSAVPSVDTEAVIMLHMAGKPV
ncbi:hypothetical protein ACE3JS_25025, partial [Enterobacter hormaechei subsp. steigerwaltii]